MSEPEKMRIESVTAEQEEIEAGFAKFIARNKWIFAKTYAMFCPHEYIVKDRLSDEDKVEFEKYTQFIRDYGWEAIYAKKKPNRYYSMGDYYYWTMGDPIEDTIIMNRARFDNFIFEVDDFGDLRCRPKPIEERRNRS